MDGVQDAGLWLQRRHFLELLRGVLALLTSQVGVDAGQDTTRGDGHLAEELGEFFIIANSQLDVAGDDPLLLVVLGSVTGQLEDLSDEVLEDSSHVDRGTSSNATCIASLLQVTSDTTNGELKTSLGASALSRTRLLCNLTATTFTFTGHLFISLTRELFDLTDTS